MAQVEVADLAKQFTEELVADYWEGLRGPAQPPTEIEYRFVRFVLEHASEEPITPDPTGFSTSRSWRIVDGEAIMSPLPFTKVNFEAIQYGEASDVPNYYRRPGAGLYLHTEGEGDDAVTGILFESGSFGRPNKHVGAYGVEGRSRLSAGTADFVVARLSEATLEPLSLAETAVEV